MATIIKRTVRHVCREEIDRDISVDEVYLGTIVECSCGQQFIRRDDQRDGLYWADHAGYPRAGGND